MKVSYNRGMVIGDWLLLVCLIISGILLTGDVGKYPYASAVFVISLVWLLVRIIKYGFSYCFKIEYHDSPTTTSQTVSIEQKDVKPYPMESGASNVAIGAIDKCCEFAAYCEKYVLPAGVCSPEPLEGYIIVSSQAISFGFTWKTFYYSLDSLIEKQGYSINTGGFSFSENSGMVFFERRIPNEDPEFAKAYSYVIDTPVEEVVSKFQSVAEKNFTSLGLDNHSASCKCTRNDAGMKEFVFTA